MDFKTRYKYNSRTDLLGRGGFATVFKAEDTLLGRTVALKFFKNNNDHKKTLIKEISRAIGLEHPNLCRYYDAALLQSDNMHGDTENIEVGVMEYLDAGHLKTYLAGHPGHFDKLLTDVLRGLEFLHEAGIIHRDLKPANILIKLTPKGPLAKITDFGISKDINAAHTASSQLLGTVEYMAPEQFNPGKYGINGKIATNLDLWSFGLMMYELRTGNSMFGSRSGHSSAEQVMSNILNDELVGEKIQDVPAPYHSILKMCLVKNAGQRVQTARQLINVLEGVAILPPPPPDPGLTRPINLPRYDPGATQVLNAPNPPKPPGPPRPAGPPKPPGPKRPQGPARPAVPPGYNGANAKPKTPATLVIVLTVAVLCIVAIIVVIFAGSNSSGSATPSHADTNKADTTISVDSTVKAVDSAAVPQNIAGTPYHLIDYFDDNASDWGVGSDSYGVVAIENGKMQIKSSDTGGLNLVEKTTNIDVDRDWDYSVTATWVQGVNDYGFGLTFACGEINKEKYEYRFYISANHYYRILSIKNSTDVADLQAWTENSFIHETNVLRVTKSGGNISFYINGHLVQSITADRPLGSAFGLMVTDKQTAEFDDFSLTGTNK